MRTYSRQHNIQQLTNILCNRPVLLKLENILLLMFIGSSKARCINKLSCVIVASPDGCNANAEHWRQQQWHIYVEYVPPHTQCAWFGMLAMFRATAAEVW